MASELRVNTITSTTGIGTVTFDGNGASFSGNPSFGNATITSINNGPISGARNRIINGDMRIDQRNNGASGTAIGVYTVDRWYYYASQASKGTWQRNAGSVTPPVGFTSYLGYTSSSAYTPLAGDIFGLSHVIEGHNISDLAFGTANAKPITLSFWVRSSLTGQFGGFIKNGGNDVAGNSNRFCGFTFNINATNTWEYKTITFPGDTSGSWDSTNGPGLAIAFSLGSGSTNIGGTPLTWGNTFYQQPSGSVNLVQTNGATFQVTGVQLEQGPVATPFERRSYGQELALCQRYYVTESSFEVTNVAGATLYDNKVNLTLPVTMRVSPSVSLSGTKAASTGNTSAGGITPQRFNVNIQSTSGTGERGYSSMTYTATAEL